MKENAGLTFDCDQLDSTVEALLLGRTFEGARASPYSITITPSLIIQRCERSGHWVAILGIQRDAGISRQYPGGVSSTQRSC